MGRRGPAKTPTALAVLRGERQDRLNLDEPTPADDKPLMPEWVNGDDEWAVRWRQVWERTCAQIGAAKYLHRLDEDMLIQYVTAVVDTERLGRTLLRSPILERDPASGGPKSLTVRREWQGALASALRLAGQFGLTPSSRTAIKAHVVSGATSEDERQSAESLFA